jgi:hypothetical protein
MKFESPNPTPQEAQGNKFLKNRFELHTTDEVVRATEKTTRMSGEKVPQKPEYTIQAYIERLNGVLHPEDESQKDRNIEMIKRSLHEQCIIQSEDIPDSYWELQRRIAQERGETLPEEFSEESKQEAHDILSKDQKESLDYWVDYLASDDAKDAYPDWAKIWAFKSVLSMADYNKEKQSFGKRSKTTTGPFPDLNQEALTTAIEYMQGGVAKAQIENPIAVPEDNPHTDEEKAVSDEDFQKLLSTENFSRFYAFAIEHVVADTSELWKNTAGSWVKFEQGSDPEALTNTLQGKGTGWCTAGKHTADAQLQSGDFYIYYSENDLGEAKIPRLAIRMKGDSIAEVRGVAHKQEIDPYISPVLEEKMDEFGTQGEAYQKKSANMQHLTRLHNQQAQESSPALTADDLRFLYELDGKIEGFGYQQDPRIDEVLKGRDMVSDWNSIFAGIGNWEGNLNLESLTSAKGLTLPDTIGDSLNLDSLTSADGLTLPHIIGANLFLNSLTSADGLTLPHTIGADLDLESLTSADGLTLPHIIGADLDLDNLTSADGLTLPHTIGANLFLDSLTSSEGLTLPHTIGANLFLNSLTSADGLTLPHTIGGSLELESLTSADKEKLRQLYPQHADKI